MLSFTVKAGRQMEPEANLVTQLLDALDELLIENQALRSGIGVLEQFLPVQARDRIRKHVAGIKADPKVRGVVQRGFAQYRTESLESTVEQLLLRELKKKDVN